MILGGVHVPEDGQRKARDCSEVPGPEPRKQSAESTIQEPPTLDDKKKHRNTPNLIS